MSAPMLSLFHQWKGKYSSPLNACRIITVIVLLDWFMIIPCSRPALAFEIILLESRIWLRKRTKHFNVVLLTSMTLLLHMNYPSSVTIIFLKSKVHNGKYALSVSCILIQMVYDEVN